MDPNATLRDLMDALDRGDRDDALLALLTLTTWLERGGFLPTPSKETR